MLSTIQEILRDGLAMAAVVALAALLTLATGL